MAIKTFGIPQTLRMDEAGITASVDFATPATASLGMAVFSGTMSVGQYSKELDKIVQKRLDR